ncbi:hypothetical protein MGYG_04942 [Nannizzia gypsea CBS 118893]|uniref:RNase III domain-containing protein n=1 Tax=Arthroderma gypseum (strain ATCC MYA-4604 / CBS 118893) TaxID=535722 RepID=E4UXP6_ARTGP|nr:hypothetical protein MGYG_04942 [Nannizzia gypsea CBS 118893]EFR01941.1 hypothetical protein MGYG_04942 [Nannizzia gypsea CBS 118893]
MSDDDLKKMLNLHMWRAKAMEDLLGYHFKNRVLALHALNLPGRFTSIPCHTGLAQLGKAAMELLVITDGYYRGLEQDKISTIMTLLLDSSKLADIAAKKGVGRCMIGNRSGDNLLPLYMARTIQALFGAILVDSNGDTSKLSDAMRALKLLPPRVN